MQLFRNASVFIIFDSKKRFLTNKTHRINIYIYADLIC